MTNENSSRPKLTLEYAYSFGEDTCGWYVNVANSGNDERAD